MNLISEVNKNLRWRYLIATASISLIWIIPGQAATWILNQVATGVWVTPTISLIISILTSTVILTLNFCLTYLVNR